jgi:magnesium chelatase family protein
MTARSVALFRVDGTVVDIHVALHPTTSGLDDDRTVAHPSTSPATRQDPTREMTERVRAAIRNSGLRWPDSPVTIDLAPEVRPNTVVGCDLALVCAIQAGMGTLTELQPAETAALGGLTWTGPSGRSRRGKASSSGRYPIPSRTDQERPRAQQRVARPEPQQRQQ